MTIFQKMLIVPLVSLIIYTSFIKYSNTQYTQSNKNVEEIRDNYIPLLDTAADNNRLFHEISQIFKDAVLADESSWIFATEDTKHIIEENFKQLQKFPNLVDEKILLQSKNNFDKYYNNAKVLALHIINGENKITNQSSLNLMVEKYFVLTEKSFSELRLGIYQHFQTTIDMTNQDMKNLLFWGGMVSLLLILMLSLVTLVTSFSTRKNLNQLISSMQSLAEGGTDYSRRLKPTSRDELGTLIYWFNQLSLKLEKEHTHLETISNTDKLTQLNNRLCTDVYLEGALIESKQNQSPLSVAIMDIDFFKNINDSFGHQVGDEVLQDFAEILNDNTRPNDFVGRWGGEEFIIIYTHLTLIKAKKLIERLRLIIQSYDFKIAGNQTASFGLTQARVNDDVNSLFKRIDTNLYKAKEQGRNHVIFE